MTARPEQGVGTERSRIPDIQYPPPGLNVRLAQLAADQHGVVTSRQLQALGLGRSAIAERVTRGTLHRLGRGLYAVGHRRVSPAGLRHGALLAAGAGAVLSHATAAAVWGLMPERRTPVHVTVARKVDSRGWITVHSVRHLDASDLVRRDHLPITSLTRTLLELSDSEEPQVLRRAVREAQVRYRVSEYAVAPTDRAHTRPPRRAAPRRPDRRRAGTHAERAGGPRPGSDPHAKPVGGLVGLGGDLAPGDADRARPGSAAPSRGSPGTHHYRQPRRDARLSRPITSCRR